MSTTIESFTKDVASYIEGAEAIEVRKNNGVMMWAVIVKDGEINISPTIYTDGYYNGGATVEETVQMVKDVIERTRLHSSFDLSWLVDFDKVKHNLYFKLVNAEKNKGSYGISASSYGFDDLWLIPCIKVLMDDGAIGSIAITEQLRLKWDVSDNTLFSYAYEGIEEPVVKSLGVILEINSSEDMTIVTNTSGSYGAASVIKAEGILEDMFPEGYILIPSSVHEMIVLPSDLMDEEQVNNIISEVNNSQVDPIDVLSNHLYKF